MTLIILTEALRSDGRMPSDTLTRTLNGRSQVEVKKFDAHQASFLLTRDQLAAMHQALNEVCYGIDVVDFEAKMGAKLTKVDQKMDRFSKIYYKMKKQRLTEGIVNFSDRELRMIIGALQEVCRGLPDWEFPIRMGAEVDEIDEILVELISVYQK